MVAALDGGKEEIIKIIRNVVVNATVDGPERDDLEKSVQHTLVLIIQVLEFEGDNNGVLEAECKSAVLLCLCIVNRWKSSHSLYLARDEMAAEYDELLRQVEHFQMMDFLDNAIQLCENSDDAEKMRRLLDEVDVLWCHVAEADAVGDYVVTLEKISIKALDNSNKLKLSRKLHGFKVRDRVFGSEKAESLKLEKEKQLIADRLAVLDQEHDRTLGERIQDSSCVEELRKRLQARWMWKSSPRAEIDVDIESKIALIGEPISHENQTHVVQVGVFECSFYNLIFCKFIYDLNVAVKMNANDSNYTVGENEAMIEDLKVNKHPILLCNFAYHQDPVL
ncbi:hypothetical protein T07_2938 [Trichinella nelsoni]|uniref:Uncharacterized protein n=1 Tax=Trichinella nelsoni TaxID=6336 RepID=A0A0V0RFJ1_9BILA|nr:hypothetical protein T07_2938 [Trichinella nelsoni]